MRGVSTWGLSNPLSPPFPPHLALDKKEFVGEINLFEDRVHHIYNFFFSPPLFLPFPVFVEGRSQAR